MYRAAVGVYIRRRCKQDGKHIVKRKREWRIPFVMRRIENAMVTSIHGDEVDLLESDLMPDLYSLSQEKKMSAVFGYSRNLSRPGRHQCKEREE